MKRGNGELSPLAQMRAGKRPIRVVSWPGDPDLKVGLRIPSDYDMQQARLDAWGYVVNVKKVDPETKRGASMLDDEIFARVLAAALVMPEGDGATDILMCDDADDLRQNTTPKEREALLRELAEFSNEMDPDLNTAEGAKRAADLIEGLEKKVGSRAALMSTLRGIPPTVLRSCIISLVERPSTSTEEKSLGS